MVETKVPKKEVKKQEVKQDAAKEVAKEIKEELNAVLWCTKCQRGISGHPRASQLKAGDYCPFCYDKQAVLGDKADFSNITLLRTTDDVANEHREMARLEKMKRKVVTGQNPTADIEKKLERKYETIISDQNTKIEYLTKMVEGLTKK